MILKAMRYQAQQFAERAGVTVRTLHHYDRLGLLKPAGRTEAGYRLYTDRDFQRLEQIVVLKYLGLPLKQIKDLLDQRGRDLPGVLRFQRRILEERRNLLSIVVQALHEAERRLNSGEMPGWEMFKKIIEVIEMQNNTEWMMRYYNDEARAKVEDRKNLWSPELQDRVTKNWAALIRDVEAVLGEDPASAKVQALVERWQKLVEGFTGGDPQIQQGLNAMYADRANWPPEFPKPFSDQVQAFMIKAMSARRQG